MATKIFGLLVTNLSFSTSGLRIAVATGMDEEATLEECVAQLIQLEEDRFTVGFHQCVEKD